MIFGDVGVARGSDKVDENEIDIGRCHHMSDIVVRPDFPAVLATKRRGKKIVEFSDVRQSHIINRAKAEPVFGRECP